MSLSEQNQRPRGHEEIALEYRSAVMAISHGIVLGFKEIKETELEMMPRIERAVTYAVAKGIYDGLCMLKKDELDVSNAVKDGVFAAVFSIGVVAVVLLIVWQLLRWFGSSFGFDEQ